MATQVGIRELLEAGVHFGHQTRRWNPKMRRFIYGERAGIYIIDLLRTDFDVPYPLADRRPWVSGRDLVYEAQERSRLDVMPSSVVDAAGGWVAAKGGVAAVVVVGVQPGR